MCEIVRGCARLVCVCVRVCLCCLKKKKKIEEPHEMKCKLQSFAEQQGGVSLGLVTLCLLVTCNFCEITD